MKKQRAIIIASFAIAFLCGAAISGASAYAPPNDPCTDCWIQYFECTKTTDDRWYCISERDTCLNYGGCIIL